MAAAKILITGAGGQLGRAVARKLGARSSVTALSHSDLEITDSTAVRDRVSQLRPDWIVNCAAWTDVDGAESDASGAYRVNDAAVGCLADAALDVGACVLHFGTDYVFDGSGARPYRESDPTGPLNVYGASKLAGELRLLAHPVKAIVVRTSWLYDGHGKNFFRTILEKASDRSHNAPLRVVSDQIGTPTDVGSVAEQVEALLDADIDGLVHASCEGEASWFEFATRIVALAGSDAVVEPVPTTAFPRAAKRPSYSVLENARLSDCGVDRMLPWDVGLRRVLETLTV